MAVNIRIVSDFDNKGLKRAESSLSNFAGNAAKQVAKIGAAFAAAGAVAGARLGTDAVKAASDLGESINAVNVAFGEAASGVLKLGDTSAQAMGVSQEAFNNAAVRFSAFAERVVGEGGDVAGFIGDVSQRATDFASVFNIDVAEALQVFQSGLAGEAEPLKRFGINLLQSEVAAFAMANGIAESSSEMTEAQKVQARYGLLMEQTAKTQGDFANTSDGLANRQRILQASFQDLQAEIGEALIPVAEQLFDIFADDILPILEDFGDWINSSDGQKAVADFGDAVGDSVQTLKDFGEWFQENLPNLQRAGETLLILVGSIAAYTAGVKLATAATVIFNAAFRLTPWGLAVTAIGGTIAAIQFFSEETSTAKTELEKLNGELSDTEAHEIHKKALAEVEDETGVAVIGSGRMSEQIQQLAEQFRAGKITQEEYEAQLKSLNDQTNNGYQAQIEWNDGVSKGSQVAEELSNKDGLPTWYNAVKGQADEATAAALGFVDASLQVLQLELRDLVRFGAAQEDIDNLKNLIIELKEEQETAFVAPNFTSGIGDAEEATEDLAETLEDTLNNQITSAIENIENLDTELGKLFDTSEELGATQQGLENYFDSLISGLEGTLSAEEFAAIGDEMRAFLDENTRDLQQYARRRDQLLQDRDFARELIFGTAEAVTAAGNITGLIDDTLTSVEKIDVSEVIEGVVDSADGLRGFKTTLTKNYTEVIEETASAADNLTQNFRGVVERTEDFLANLRTLKELGLDPMLFNQLVEAGVEAGGATAQALVEGGSDTVDEVNKLQGELEELGIDIGEETYETMKNAGEQFSSGIVDGIEDNLEQIEIAGENAADAFAEAFEARLQELLAEIMAGLGMSMDGGGVSGASYPSHSEGRDSTGGVGYGVPAQFGDVGEIVKIANQTRGASLADIASQYDVEFDKMVEANPKFFDPGHKDFKPGYQEGEYLFSNTTVNIPKFADGGVVMDQLLGIIGEAGPEAVIPLDRLDRMMNGGATYNIYVNASGRAGGQQAGQEIVKALKQYQTTNGSVNTALTGIGS